MKSYKLYTEWIESETYMLNILSDIITPHFPGWNYTRQFGVWKGKAESAVVIEIIADDRLEYLVNAIAYTMCKEFAQEAVLVTSTKLSDAVLISVGGIDPLGEPDVVPDECACCENCCECRCGKD